MSNATLMTPLEALTEADIDRCLNSASCAINEEMADHTFFLAVEHDALKGARLIGPYLVEAVFAGALVADLTDDTFYLIPLTEGAEA